MGPYLSEPIIQKKIDIYEFLKINAYSCSMQGWRKQMQDSHFAIQLHKDNIYIFGVLDGHGGPQVSSYVAKMFVKQLLHEANFKLKNYAKALTNTFKRMDDMLMSNKGETQLLKIRKQLMIPTNGAKQSISQHVGCTANIILITKQKLYIANIGDSRAVLCRNNVAIALSQDHKPDNPNEKIRITKAGATVTNGRVNGGLNLSRSFGDFAFKSVPKKSFNEQPIICIPDVMQIERNPEDQFIIMGCDGIWEKYIKNNQQMVNYIKKLKHKHQSINKFYEELFTNFLGKSAEEEIGCDNMTAILIQFN